jgi:hypothetical protein
MPDPKKIPFPRVGGKVQTPNGPIVMNLGDTIQYVIDGGGEVVFDDGLSPFDKSTIKDQEIVTVVNSGHFLCQIRRGGTFVEWTPPALGADHDVPKK